MCRTGAAENETGDTRGSNVWWLGRGWLAEHGGAAVGPGPAAHAGQGVAWVWAPCRCTSPPAQGSDSARGTGVAPAWLCTGGGDSNPTTATSGAQAAHPASTRFMGETLRGISRRVKAELPATAHPRSGPGRSSCAARHARAWARGRCVALAGSPRRRRPPGAPARRPAPQLRRAPGAGPAPARPAFEWP